MIQWVCIIIGAGGTGFSAYMHFKIQNAAVTPITKVDEKDSDAAPANNADNKVHLHQKLDPVKLMNQSENAKKN